jgi:lipopolysaccharide biosynthesis protein
LVFADDPSLLGWGKNKPYAEQLGSQLGLMDLPDCCFNFPVGTMFWARPKALKPLFDLEFSWDMYPEEPLPYDGSLLHAIERLLPLVTEKQQFKRAVVYTPGLTR